MHLFPVTKRTRMDNSTYIYVPYYVTVNIIIIIILNLLDHAPIHLTCIYDIMLIENSIIYIYTLLCNCVYV